MSKVSIIMTAYNMTPVSTHITMAALANIVKYTDRDKYELIVIEEEPPGECKIRDDYGVLKIDNHIVLPEYTNYTKKMNMAAAQAKGKYLCFIQNDVFVWEGWLDAFLYYFDNKMSECMIPDQFPRTREYIKEAQAMSYEQGFNLGHKEDCMYFITKKAFKKIGGWNENLKILIQQDFYRRCEEAGVAVDSTNKVQVTHITLATHYQDMKKMDELMHNDTEILNK